MVESVLLFSWGNGSNHRNYCLLPEITLLGSVNLETDGVLAEGNDLPGTAGGLCRPPSHLLAGNSRSLIYRGLLIIVVMVIVPIKMKTLGLTFK